MGNTGSISPIYAALGALAAALVTAIYSTWRLIGEKETKVSEFRKSWIESFRSSLADYTAAVHIIVGRIAIRTNHGERASSRLEQATKPKCRFFNRAFSSTRGTKSSDTNDDIEIYDRDLESELLPHWAELRRAYNLVILHLNPDEHESYLSAESSIKELEAEFRKSRVFDLHLINLLESAKSLIESDKSLLKKHGAESNHPVTQNETSTLELKTKRSSELNKFHVSAHALLLAMLATKMLLEADKYERVYQRRKYIEHGITIIDTAGANVIKGVWEEIKRGEIQYQNITKWPIRVAATGAFIIAGLFIAAIFGGEKNQPTPRNIDLGDYYTTVHIFNKSKNQDITPSSGIGETTLWDKIMCINYHQVISCPRSPHSSPPEKTTILPQK